MSNKLKLVQEQIKKKINETNNKIEILGEHTKKIYNLLNEIQLKFDAIRHMPSENKLQYEQLKQIRIQWIDQAQKIEKDYQKATIKGLGMGTAGATAGVAVVALGPSAAMGIATTFGVASTGTAISTLSGAAATNAALAWLGGGTIATGGGGIAAGNAIIALAGPIGWSIAGIALLGSGILFWKAKSEQKRLEEIFTLIGERDIKSYELAIVEINERISRIKNETKLLETAIENIKFFGLDYEKMNEKQQYELGTYLNLMNSSTQLLINPILGLQPKYSERDIEIFSQNKLIMKMYDLEKWQKDLLVVLANLLYKIQLNDMDKKLLLKVLKKNKDFLTSINIEKNKLNTEIFDIVQLVINDVNGVNGDVLF